MLLVIVVDVASKCAHENGQVADCDCLLGREAPERHQKGDDQATTANASNVGHAQQNWQNDDTSELQRVNGEDVLVATQLILTNVKGLFTAVGIHCADWFVNHGDCSHFGDRFCFVLRRCQIGSCESQ